MPKQNESKFASFLAATRNRNADVEADGNSIDPLREPMSFSVKCGKRRDPDYIQVTAYIRKSTHKAVKIALLSESDRGDFSDLVEQLLSEWVRSNK